MFKNTNVILQKTLGPSLEDHDSGILLKLVCSSFITMALAWVSKSQLLCKHCRKAGKCIPCAPRSAHPSYCTLTFVSMVCLVCAISVIWCALHNAVWCDNTQLYRYAFAVLLQDSGSVINSILSSTEQELDEYFLQPGLIAVVLAYKHIDWQNNVRTASTAEIVDISGSLFTMGISWAMEIHSLTPVRDWNIRRVQGTLGQNLTFWTIKWKELWNCRVSTIWCWVGSDITGGCQTQ